MSLLLKLIFICTCFYLLGMSTSLPRKSRKPKTSENPQESSENLQETSENLQETTENPQETSENPQETTENPEKAARAEQLKKEKESRAPNYDEQFFCIKNCTTNAFQTCDEASASNKNKEGTYLFNIGPNELEPFYAYCQRQERSISRYWILIQKRKDGSVNFYRDWFDYKYGFGNLFREYWMGLERIHQITNSKNYKLWIRLLDFDGTDYHMHYSTFAVSSEADGYKLTVGGYSGEYIDCLESHNGKKFSTFDNDVSESKYNCPDKNKAGWWYHDCVELKCNLNGQKYSNVKKAGDTSGIFWRHNQTSTFTLYYTHMAIRLA